jgi:indolepyruvate decarboxylase
VTEHSPETSAAKKFQSTSVADYIVQRIADEGVTHCFGVAGDYLFPVCNAIESSQKVKRPTMRWRQSRALICAR